MTRRDDLLAVLLSRLRIVRQAQATYCQARTAAQKSLARHQIDLHGAFLADALTDLHEFDEAMALAALADAEEGDEEEGGEG